jgi:hypothetical protein
VMPRGRVGVWACGRVGVGTSLRMNASGEFRSSQLGGSASLRPHADTPPIFPSTRDAAGDQSDEQAINSGSDAGRHGRRQVPFLILEFLCFFDVLRGWNRLGIPFLANIPFVVR